MNQKVIAQKGGFEIIWWMDQYLIAEPVLFEVNLIIMIMINPLCQNSNNKINKLNILKITQIKIKTQKTVNQTDNQQFYIIEIITHWLQ